MKRLPVRMAPMTRSMLSMVSSPRSWKRARMLRVNGLSRISGDGPPCGGRSVRRKVKRIMVIIIQSPAKA